MRVVMPYTEELRDRHALAALCEQYEDVECYRVDGDPTAYWRLLSDLWEDRTDFMLVEHDVRIAPGTVAALRDCPHPWCSCPQPLAVRWSRRRMSYPPKHSALTGTDDFNSWSAACLQVNRFRRELMLQEPSLLTDVAAPNRYWLVLDEHTVGRLRQRCHVHYNLATHHAPAIPRASDHVDRRAAYVDWAMTNHPDTWVDAANGALERVKRRAEAATWLAYRARESEHHSV